MMVQRGQSKLKFVNRGAIGLRRGFQFTLTPLIQMIKHSTFSFRGYFYD